MCRSLSPERPCRFNGFFTVLSAANRNNGRYFSKPELSNMASAHTFHIPVMGIGYTIDTPLKVSHFGIDSVISLVDDMLMEKLRKMYCHLHEISYSEISEKTEDYRAKRITSYLNLINSLVEKKIDGLKAAIAGKGQEIRDYFGMLPDGSQLREEFFKRLSRCRNLQCFREWISENLSPGSIDVNIMTKADRRNFIRNLELPAEYNDAHAALRGYANSDLCSSIVFSAGMNPGLYSYLENFDDFYPDADGRIRKKIVIKASDFRSASIQGRFLAKKGLWVSEFRIESGLNCGGHAFATDGFLLGPILAEFSEKREELTQSMYSLLIQSLVAKNRVLPESVLPMKLTVQGGVGTAEEHHFLLQHYQVDSVGWGTPFLLVPEVVNVDADTLQRMQNATEKDLYLSNISPLGVPFNSMRGNTKDLEKDKLIRAGMPGSRCPKKYVAMNTEFAEKGLCTASRQYQRLKIRQLEAENLPHSNYQARYNAIVDKSCICVGLGTSALLVNDLDTRAEGSGVSVCPGPNLAYFSRVMSLKEITDHIYGRANMMSRTDRPHMFIKEVNLYIDYLKSRITEARASLSIKQASYLSGFADNLNEGVSYYERLLESSAGAFKSLRGTMQGELKAGRAILSKLKAELLHLRESAFLQTTEK